MCSAKSRRFERKMLTSQQNDLPKILGTLDDDLVNDVAHAIETCNSKASAHVLISRYGNVIVLQNDNAEEVCQYLRHLRNEGERKLKKRVKTLMADLCR